MIFVILKNMARTKYGTTPWGKWFLEMLDAFDDSGRLARGKSYANTGKVSSLIIKENSVAAKVKGNYQPWYHVLLKFPKLESKTENIIRKCLEKNPIELASLRAGSLTEGFINLLKEKKVRLIPAKWDLVERECTCPDFGDPCKHMAAVLYLLAKEIDHDPRLLFKLAGFDLGSVKISDEDDEFKFIPSIEPPVPTSLRKQNDTTSKEQITKPLSFEVGESYIPLIQTILSEKQNFTSNNFIINLVEFYHKAIYNYGFSFYEQESKHKKDLKTKEENESTISPFLFSTIKVNTENLDLKNTSFPLQHKKHLTLSINTNKNTTTELTLLQAFPIFNELKQNESFSKTCCMLISLYNIAGKLIQNSGFIPAVFSQNKKVFIYWTPLFSSAEIKTDIEQFAEIIDDDFFEYVSTWGKTYCATLLLTAFLTEYVDALRFFPQKMSSYETEINSLFFKGEPININVPGYRNLDTVIYSWLSVLHYNNSGYEYRLTLEQAKSGDDFLLSALARKKPKEKQPLENTLNSVDEKNESENFSLEAEYIPPPFIPLNTAIKKSKNPEELLRFPAALASYFNPLSILVIKANVHLSEEETSNFLRVSSKLLQKFGIDVVLPKALQKILVPRTVISVTKVKGGGNVNSFLKLTDVLQYNRQIMLGDTVISFEEFTKLIENKSGLVKFNEEYILLDPDQVAKMFNNFKRQPTTSEAMQAFFSGEAEYSDEAKNIFTSIFRKPDINVPTNLNASLRPYQEHGFKWLYTNVKSGLGCLLADDMGLGKTIQIISLILAFKNSGELDAPVLIIVPASLISNWEHEIKKFAPELSISIFHGLRRKFLESSDVIITTYQTVQKDIDKIKDKELFFAILDEAQAIKNAATKKAKAVKALKAKARIAMTGTPVENNLEDMRSIFDFFLPGYLGSAQEFKKAWRIPIELHNSKKIADELKKITSPFLMRRVKTDPKVISDLPDKIITNQYCNLTPEQLALYENLVDTELDKIINEEEKPKRKVFLLKLITSLKQVCNHPRSYDKITPIEASYSGKTIALLDLLNEILLSGEKTIIFSQYVDTLKILQEIIKKELNTEPLVLHGGMTTEKRKKAVEEFQNDPRYRIFLISLKAGGTGLNLTAANRVIHFDLWYNPAVEDQATDRAFRIGQTKTVFVHRFICAGTFEETIDKMIQTKRKISSMTVSSGETWISKLTNEELIDLFGKKKALRKKK